MGNKSSSDYSSISIVLSCIIFSVAYGIISMFVTYFYDLNDDALIANILSGAYTGTPEAHCIQMLYPVSWILTKLYSINPMFPWLGTMEVVLMWICLVLIFSRTHTLILNHTKKKVIKILGIFGLYTAGLAFVIGCFLWEIVMLQYTVICGLLAATAAYLFLTSEDFKVSDNIIPIVLVILAFNIRSEMLLLMCPFLAAAGICKWIPEGFNKHSCKKYLTFISIIIAGIGISYAIDQYAYSSPQWKEFNRFFDARTQVYDFTGIPNYEKHPQFYELEHVTKDDYDRLIDYNFVLSERVNASLLEDIAKYATENATYSRSIPWAVFDNIKSMLVWKSPKAKSALTDNRLAFFEEGEKLHTPYNFFVITLYALIIVCAIITKNARWAYSLPICFVMRLIAWGYVVYKGRVNARIAHPLYLIEILVLIGLFLMAWCESDYLTMREKKITGAVLLVGLVIGGFVSLAFVPSTIRDDIRMKTDLRNEYNSQQAMLYSYTSKNPRNYYLLDVYTTVNFTQPLFPDTHYGQANTQLAGGWAALSPLDAKKQAYYEDKSCWYFISADDWSDTWDEVDSIFCPTTNKTLHVYSMYD